MTGRRTETVLLVVNGVGVVAAAAFSAVGVHRPGYVSHAEPVTPLATFWTMSSAVRTWALAGPLLVALRRSDSGSRSALLVVAGLTQLGDAVSASGAGTPRCRPLPRSWASCTYSAPAPYGPGRF